MGRDGEMVSPAKVGGHAIMIVLLHPTSSCSCFKLIAVKVSRILLEIMGNQTPSEAKVHPKTETMIDPIGGNPLSLNALRRRWMVSMNLAGPSWMHGAGVAHSPRVSSSPGFDQ